VLPTTRWLVFNSGQPLVIATSDNPTKRSLVYLTTDDVKPLLGSEPFFGQERDQGQLVIESSDVSHSPTAAARHRGIPVVFLGIHEPPSKSSALPSSAFVDPDTAITNLEGTPYFSMDVTDLELAAEKLQDILSSTSQARNGVLSWSEPRVLISSLDGFSGGLFAESRSLIDWNQRNKVSPRAFPLICSRRENNVPLIIVLSSVWVPFLLHVGWLEAFVFVIIAMGK